MISPWPRTPSSATPTPSTLLHSLFIFFFPFLGTPWHMEVPGRGSAPSHSCDPSHSYCNARSFNSLCPAGDWTCVPTPQSCHLSCCTTVQTPFFHVVVLLLQSLRLCSICLLQEVFSGSQVGSGPSMSLLHAWQTNLEQCTITEWPLV